MSLVARFALALPLLAATPALAQETPPPREGPAIDRDTVTVGVGAVYMPDYEGSNDYRVAPAPGAIGSVSGFSFVLAGNRASVDLIPNRPGPGWDLQAGPLAVVNFDRSSTRSIDDARVKALGKVDTAVELGGYVGIGKTGLITSDYDKLSVSLSWRHDVAGAHDSSILQPSINYMTPLSRKAAVVLFASAERAAGGYADTYFSITPEQSAASGLPVYRARAGWKNWSAGALAMVSIDGDLLHGFKLIGGGVYRGMLGDFAESPIVRDAGSRSQWMGVLGLGYTF